MVLAAGKQAAVADPQALVATGAVALQTVRVAVADVEDVEAVAAPSVAASVVTAAVVVAVDEVDTEAERARVVLHQQRQEASHRSLTTSCILPTSISDTPSPDILMRWTERDWTRKPVRSP